MRNQRFVSALEWRSTPSTLINNERDGLTLHIRAWWGCNSEVLGAFPVEFSKYRGYCGY